MPTDLTPAELSVLEALWLLERATVAQVRERYATQTGGDPAYTTVMTLLGRLVAKGAATVDRTREPYVYRPRQRRRSVLRARLRELVDTLFDGRAEDLVLQLMDDEALSAEDLRRIERKVAGRRGRREDER